MSYNVKGKFQLDKTKVKATNSPYVFEYDFDIDFDDEPDTDDIRLAIGYYLSLLPETTDGRPTIVGDLGIMGGDGDDN